MKTMISKYAGQCRTCNGSIARGEMIAWSRYGGAQHPKCAGVYVPEPVQDRRAPCWECRRPEGKFRAHGAATPVYCDTCNAKFEQRRQFVPDPIDTLYEDQCATACGL